MSVARADEHPAGRLAYPATPLAPDPGPNPQFLHLYSVEMMSFTFNTTPAIVFRAGASPEIASLGPVTDAGLLEQRLCDDAIASLRAAGMAVKVFSDVEPDPSLQTLLAARDAGQAQGADLVIGFGGGSCLDLAELSALLLGSGETIDDAWGVAWQRVRACPSF